MPLGTLHSVHSSDPMLGTDITARISHLTSLLGAQRKSAGRTPRPAQATETRHFQFPAEVQHDGPITAAHAQALERLMQLEHDKQEWVRERELLLEQWRLEKETMLCAWREDRMRLAVLLGGSSAPEVVEALSQGIPELPSSATALLAQHVAADRVRARAECASGEGASDQRSQEVSLARDASHAPSEHLYPIELKEGEHEHDLLLKELERKLMDGEGRARSDASPARDAAKDRVKALEQRLVQERYTRSHEVIERASRQDHPMTIEKQVRAL